MDAVGGVEVRVGVFLGDRAVGGPAGVADPGARLGTLGHRHRRGTLLGAAAYGLDRLAQRAEVPDRPHGVDPVALQHRDPSAVVAAVLELLEPGQQQWARLARTYVPDDSTHPS